MSDPIERRQGTPYHVEIQAARGFLLQATGLPVPDDVTPVQALEGLAPGSAIALHLTNAIDSV